MTRPVIALDADGVLLDYNRAYAQVWERTFGVAPQERDPNAYWALDRWAVERLSGEAFERFRARFDETFWSTLPAMSGAVEAAHPLHDAGYTLVCVTAMPACFAEARQRNLRDLGFPIERVIATGNRAVSGSPKAGVLADLKPVAFVDDYLPYFEGVAADIHTALVMREPNGSPNVGPGLGAVRSTHASLSDFSDWWLSRA